MPMLFRGAAASNRLVGSTSLIVMPKSSRSTSEGCTISYFLLPRLRLEYNVECFPEFSTPLSSSVHIAALPNGYLKY